MDFVLCTLYFMGTPNITFFTSCRRLAKSPESALDTLIRDLPDSPEKMAVLRILADQMTLPLETGRTNSGEFRDGH